MPSDPRQNSFLGTWSHRFHRVVYRGETRASTLIALIAHTTHAGPLAKFAGFRAWQVYSLYVTLALCS